MSGQDRSGIGARLTDRLLQRFARRRRVGLSDVLLARFGVADDMDGSLLTGPADGAADGDLVFLSIRPYLRRMQQLAMARRRREQRLARFSERAVGRVKTSAWKRWPGALTSTMAARPLAGLGADVLGTSDFKLPKPPPAPVAEEPAVASAAEPRSRSRGSTARVSASPWLSTPWTGARVARSRSEAAESSARAGRAPAGRSERALDRVGSRLAGAAAGNDPLVRSLEQAAPVLSRTAQGRKLQAELVELVELPAEERAVRVRRVLRRAAASTRTVVEEVEAAVPQARPQASNLARRRMAEGPGSTGLRPVLSSSPAMRAVQPVAASPEPAAPAARPVDVASGRSQARSGAWLSTSPVRKAAVSAARQALSASPVARSRVTRLPAQARTAQATSGAHARTPSAPRRRASTGSAPGSSASRSPRAGPDEGPSTGASGGDEPAAGATPPAAAGASSAATSRTPRVSAPSQDEQALDRPAPSALARGLSRAFERLDGAEQSADDGQATPTLERVLAAAERPVRAANAVVRSAQGVYVPARTLAAPSHRVSDEAAATEPAAAAPAPRGPSVPTPSRRATYVQGLPSTARVAERSSPTRHAAVRADEQPRAGSVLPRVAHSPAVATSTPAVAPTASAVAPARRALALTRSADGAFVAERSAAATPAAAGAPVRTASRREGATVDSAGENAAPSSWALSRMDEAPARSGRRASLVPPVVTALAAPEPAPVAADATSAAAAPAPRRSAWATPPTAAERTARPAAVAAAERGVRTPLVGRSARRVVEPQPAATGAQRVVAEIRTRHRPSPLAYARRYGVGLDQVVVETVDLPAETAPAAAPATRRSRPATPATVASRAAAGSALDRLDLRALATASWVLDAHGTPMPDAPTAGATRQPAGWQWSPDGVVLAPPRPEAAAEPETAAEPRSRASSWASGRVERTPQGTYVPGQATGAPPASWWAGARSDRAPSARRGPAARSARPAQGRFDARGRYEAPLAAERRGQVRDAAAGPAAVPVRAPLAPQAEPAADPRAAAFHPGMPGVAQPLTVAAAGQRRPAPRSRPDLAVTLGAVDVGVDDPRLPTWARRSSGEPLIHREDRFIEALARASAPEDVVRIIYERAERGGLSPASSGLPAPVIQVIEQIRSVATAVSQADGDTGPVRAGPASDASVVRRAMGGDKAPTRSTARVARGFTALRGGGTASSRDGVGSDKLSKLSKKLQDLILLAERQQGAAREQVRMAEDSAGARAEGQASPTSAEGGNDRKIDIEALGREVLEVVSMELEMRKQRSQEGSDEYGWW